MLSMQLSKPQKVKEQQENALLLSHQRRRDRRKKANALNAAE
jgi:hypothetical protein